MKTKSELEKVLHLEKKCEELRAGIGVSACGEVLYHAPQSMWSDNDVAVEADGKGGAKLLIVCGNYPDDYSIKSERRFTTEEDACDAADEIVENATNAQTALR
jgi:hypothetical protein